MGILLRLTLATTPTNTVARQTKMDVPPTVGVIVMNTIETTAIANNAWMSWKSTNIITTITVIITITTTITFMITIMIMGMDMHMGTITAITAELTSPK
jgi:hypothetical protein